MQVAKESSFDPNKSYTWSPDSKFELSGAEFGVILNSLRVILSTPEAQRIIMANAAHEMIEMALSKAVDAGVAVEKKEEVKQ